MKNISIALLHYPVYNKNKEIVASSVTNFDIHDIARCARTYGINKYFIVHPQKKPKGFYFPAYIFLAGWLWKRI